MSKPRPEIVAALDGMFRLLLTGAATLELALEDEDGEAIDEALDLASSIIDLHRADGIDGSDQVTVEITIRARELAERWASKAKV